MNIFSKADIVYFVSLMIGIMIPARIEPSSFLQIHQPMTVVTHKNYPPYLAHLETSQVNNAQPEKKNLAVVPPIELSTLSLRDVEEIVGIDDARPLVLDEIKLFKSEMASFEIPQALLEPEMGTQNNASHGVADRRSQKIVQQGTAPQENTHPDKTHPETLQQEVGKRIVAKESAEDETNVIKTETKAALLETFSGVSRSQKDTPLVLTGEFQISNLLFGNEHSFDFRRIKGGVILERGTVDIHQGIYSIRVSEPEGQILGRLLDKNGQVIGEDIEQITYLASGKSSRLGPKLVLTPKRRVDVAYHSQYGSGSGGDILEASAHYFHGREVASQDSEQRVQETRLGIGSRTLLSVDAKKYLSSQRIVFSGEKSELPLLPAKMAKALREMVSDQRQQDLNDPNGTLIWGQSKVDGAPLAGVSVEIESMPDVAPVYFNEFFLPDPNLKATSTNGLFAFLQIEPGFHALMARRGNRYFSHDNVIVERGVVSVAEIKNSTKSKIAKIRVFHGFTRERQDARLELQSSENEIETRFGEAEVTLPNFHRMSLLAAHGDQHYANAVYQYDDASDFVDVPLVPESWILEVRAHLKINDVSNTGAIVGFVSDQNFEVYSALEDKNQVRVYFDSQGQLVQGNHGLAGGGFIIFNVPFGTNEVIIYGKNDEKLYSQVIPVDRGSLNVLSYHAEL